MRQRIVKYQSTKVVKNPKYKNYTEWKEAGLPDSEAGQGDVDSHESINAEWNEKLEAILAVLDEGGEKVLTAKQKIVFKLVVRDGLSVTDAARILGVSQPNVTKHLQKAADKLRGLCTPKLD